MQQRLTIIGVGLLGGSLGLAAKKYLSDWTVTGCAHREGSLIKAETLGAIDARTLDPVAAVRDADLVILCTPVSLIDRWLSDIAPHLKPGAIVTDVGSTKQSIVEAGERTIGGGAFFVGSHPMAGGSRTGVDSASADLFDGKTCIVTPTDRTNDDALKKVEHFWRSLGSRVVRHDPRVHDRLVALVSHLPHAAAAALVAVQNEASLDLHGKGFYDSTRIAAGDAALWRDIFAENRANVAGAIDRLVAELQTFARSLRDGNDAGIEQWLTQQAKTRGTLD
ncbi:MAG: prephenate dehydrogenase [Tepidisphaeraceae bacterium]